MADSRPLVSIGMPVYNGERFIRQALDSLIAQDYENIELIISDNASEDRTEELCQEYLATDNRIRCYRNETNLGPVKNFNRAFELSRGEYFMWAAHDDIWDVTYVRKCVEVLERTPSAVLCCTSLRFIDEDSRVLGMEYDNYDNPEMLTPSLRERVRILVSRHGWYGIYGVVRADALRRTLLARPVYGADVILSMELCLLGAFAKIPEVLFYYRQFRERTETDRARLVGVAHQHGSLYGRLSRELLSTVMKSHLDPLTKSVLVLELVSTIYLRSPAWRGRLRRETAQQLCDSWRRRDSLGILKQLPLFCCLISRPRRDRGKRRPSL
ncbi:MAG: glycosyl transferase [Nitrospira sp.]|nr:MAG: glycosyl transferase [Nitrospira sp.]